jgi:hypothetical protein
MNINIIHANCDPSLAKNRELPLNAYLVTYVCEGEVQYDVAQGDGRVSIFDHYYDKYGEVKGIEWTDGRISPKFWNYQPPVEKKKKR